ncbi:hypothetical protein H4R18_003627 [Coemansia javaensis]|uniref:SURP motif domain-containing protein n=1 Tax=Coemansia javaensis TaxID=2761396 RepID=A0A9W8LIA0_9FUNG|nr:hypothetical protein H4R18_003627 [Coemansia javaensis]
MPLAADAHTIRQQLRARRQRDSGSGAEDASPRAAGLAVFGYGARIFDAASNPLPDGHGLVDLDAGSGPPLRVDRFDIRHLLPLLPDPDPDRPTPAGALALPDPEFDAARFASLAAAATPEHAVFAMDPEERRAYIDGIARPQSPPPPPPNSAAPPGNAAIPLDYGGADEPDKGNGFEPPFAMPDGVAAPATRRHFEIIEHTARFIAGQPPGRAAQMEIVIQGKQGTNPDFAFLARASRHHRFYQHVLWLMRTGLYAYGEDSEPDTPPRPQSPPPPQPAAAVDEVQAKRRRLAAEFLRRKRLGSSS